MTTDDLLERLLRDGPAEPPPSLAAPPLDSIRRRARRRRYGQTASAAAIVVLIVAGGALALRPSADGGPIAFGDTGCDGTSLPTQVVSPGLVGSTPQPANAAELSQLAETIRRLGEDEFPAVYGGVVMDTDVDRAIVWRKPSADFDDALAALPGHEKITVMCATYSNVELLGATHQLVIDGTYWRARGLTLHQFGPDYRNNCVLVFTENPDRARAELGARYPSLPLCFAFGKGFN